MDSTIIVPIHGTFAKNATWVERDSPVMQDIQSGFSRIGVQCKVAPFRWSGRNTIEARIEASRDLADFVNNLVETNIGKPKILMLGHSHGGSVVAYAVYHNPEIRDKISGLVAMSTPWVTVRAERFLEEIRTLFARLLSLSLLLVFLGIFIPQFMNYTISGELGNPPESIYKGQSEEGSIYKDPLYSYSVAASILYLLYAIPVGAIIGVVWTALHSMFIGRVKKNNKIFARAMNEYALDMNVSNAPLPPTVLIVSEGDEASSLLRMIQWFSSLSRELLGRVCRVGVSTTRNFDRLHRFIRVFLLGAFFVGLCVTILFSGYSLVGTSSNVPKPLVLLLYGVLAIALCVLVTTLLSAVAYGSFHIYSQLYCRFGVETTPYGEHKLIMVNSSSSDYSNTKWNNILLKHSGIYLIENNINQVTKSLVDLSRQSSAGLK